MMQYEKEYELRGADFDGFDRIHPASVLALFQDVAGIHANALGVGFDALMARQTIWVLTKVRYRVVTAPKRYERVRVRTWPLPPGRVNFRREYVMEAMDGAPLIVGTSEWVVVHSEKRRVLPAGEIYPGDDYCLDTYFEGRLAKVPNFVPADAGRAVCPGFTDLDINGHVNNTKYANYVLDAAPPRKGEAIREFAIDYHREVLQDMPLQICCARQGDSVLARGVSAEGELMFSCRMELSAT